MKRLIPGLFGLIVVPALSAQTSGGTTITPGQFAAMRWIEGVWHGSGGSFPSFFETYRFVNDSTIQREAYVDSTLRNSVESATLQLRGGRVEQIRGGELRATVTRMTADSVVWAQLAGGTSTYARRGPDEWTSTLTRPNQEQIVYVLRRHRR